jgi:hypothetical protein
VGVVGVCCVWVWMWVCVLRVRVDVCCVWVCVWVCGCECGSGCVLRVGVGVDVRVCVPVGFARLCQQASARAHPSKQWAYPLQ